jgi:hypothetical protein
MKRIDGRMDVKSAAVAAPSRVVPLKSFGQRETAEMRAERSIPFGRRRGPLTVGPRTAVGVSRKFLLTCDCGHSGWYGPMEILALLDAGRGCQGPQCSAMGYREVVWTGEPHISRRLQLFTLLLLRKSEVQSWWGGALDDVSELSFSEGYANFSAYVRMPHVRKKGPWIRRLDENLPFLEGNIMLAAKPDPLFQRMRQEAIEIDGQRVKVNELCELTSLNPADLMLKIFRLGTCDDLMYKLMSEEDV